MQERRNSIANALELRLSCTNPTIRYNGSQYLAITYQSQWQMGGYNISILLFDTPYPVINLTGASIHIGLISSLLLGISGDQAPFY